MYWILQYIYLKACFLKISYVNTFACNMSTKWNNNFELSSIQCSNLNIKFQKTRDKKIIVLI